jgi:hypothetical protein
MQSADQAHYENVVCDVHLAEMTRGRLTHPHKYVTTILDGWRCPVESCARFFGTELFGLEGYGDLQDGDLANIRLEPACSTEHETRRMYIRGSAIGLRWVCPTCGVEAPFQQA